MILRVFISYSHQDPRSAEIRNALAAALLAEPKRFGLLADAFTLEPGDAWGGSAPSSRGTPTG